LEDISVIIGQEGLLQTDTVQVLTLELNRGMILLGSFFLVEDVFHIMDAVSLVIQGPLKGLDE